jgi:hypothetical protein
MKYNQRNFVQEHTSQLVIFYTKMQIMYLHSNQLDMVNNLMPTYYPCTDYICRNHNLYTRMLLQKLRMFQLDIVYTSYSHL